MVTDPIISFHFSSPSVFGQRSYHKFPFLFSLRFWSQTLSLVSISLLPPFLVTDPIISFHFSSPSVFGHRSYHKFTFFPSLFHGGSTYHRPNAVCHAMSLCAACAGTADLRQPPCTLWCRLRAAGECRRHARATAAYPQTVSWPPLPFSPTNTNHFFIKTCSQPGHTVRLATRFTPSNPSIWFSISSLTCPSSCPYTGSTGSPPTPLPFFPSPTSPACLLLDTLLAWYTLFPPYILEANATDSQRCMTVSRGYSPPFCSSGVIHPLSFPLPRLSLPPLYPDLSLYVL